MDASEKTHPTCQEGVFFKLLELGEHVKLIGGKIHHETAQGLKLYSGHAWKGVEEHRVYVLF